MKVAVPLAPGSRANLAKPRSCCGGPAGAPEGMLTYNCATSAAATDPLLVMVAVTVATGSNKSLRPPGAMGPVAGPDVAVEVTLALEYVKLEYAASVLIY